MNIFMTGHAGLIGSVLKERLEKEGHKIVKAIDIRCGENICDIDKCVIPHGEKIDLLIHAAAHCKINESVTNPQKTYINDVYGTFCVMEFCRKNNIKKLVYFSSSRVLNKEKNPYTSAKLYGEELCKAYRDCYGIDYVIIRPSTVYGPFWDKTNRLVHIFITNALNGKDLEILGDPKIKTLDFTYVDDFVNATMLAINNKEWNKEYNISGEEEFNVYELAQFIIKNTNSKSNIIVKEAEVAQPQKVKLDVSEIKKLGYVPKVSLKEGILRCIKWYKEFLEKNKEI